MESMPLKSTTQPISVFQVNGALDPIIPINGGPGPGTHIFLDALQSAKVWANKFNCFEPQIRMIGEDTLYEFKNCDDGKEIRYLRIENGEHNVLNPFLKPLFITSSLLKFMSYCSLILIFLTV